MTKITEGGIRMPKGAACRQCRRTKSRLRSRSGAVLAGATLPMVAAVASDDPQIAPNPAQAPTGGHRGHRRARWPKECSPRLVNSAQSTCPTPGGELAHQQEQRNDTVRAVAGEGRIGLGLQLSLRSGPGVAVHRVIPAAKAAQQHGEADGRAQKDHAQQELGKDHKPSSRACSCPAKGKKIE